MAHVFTEKQVVEGIGTYHIEHLREGGSEGGRGGREGGREGKFNSMCVNAEGRRQSVTVGPVSPHLFHSEAHNLGIDTTSLKSVPNHRQLVHNRPHGHLG